MWGCALCGAQGDDARVRLISSLGEKLCHTCAYQWFRTEVCSTYQISEAVFDHALWAVDHLYAFNYWAESGYATWPV